MYEDSFHRVHPFLHFFQVYPQSLWSTPVMQALVPYQSTSMGHPRSKWIVVNVPKATKSPTHPWHLATISSPSNTAGHSTSWAALSKLKSQVCLTVILPSDLWISDDKCLGYETNVPQKKSVEVRKMLCHSRSCCSVYILHKMVFPWQYSSIFPSLLAAYKWIFKLM